MRHAHARFAGKTYIVALRNEVEGPLNRARELVDVILRDLEAATVPGQVDLLGPRRTAMVEQPCRNGAERLDLPGKNAVRRALGDGKSQVLGYRGELARIPGNGRPLDDRDLGGVVDEEKPRPIWALLDEGAGRTSAAEPR